MKRFNPSMVRRFSLLLGAVLLFISTISCKSQTKAFSVKPSEILSSSGDVFISVPKKADPEFLKSIVSEYAGEISEADLQKLIDRVEKAYCGISEEKSGYSFQGVVLCNIPKSFASNIFTQKRGFSKMEYQSGKNKFDVFTQDKMNLSFPESNLLCISSGTSVTSMLDSYVNLRNNGVDPDSSEEKDSDFNYVDFLETSNDEIRFYSPNPCVILSKLTGFTKISLNLNLKYISGAFTIDSENPENYLASFDLNFENSKYVKAGKVLLGMAFAFGKPEIVSDSENPSLLTVKGISINKNQLYRILSN